MNGKFLACGQVIRMNRQPRRPPLRKACGKIVTATCVGDSNGNRRQTIGGCCRWPVKVHTHNVAQAIPGEPCLLRVCASFLRVRPKRGAYAQRSEEHTSELQSLRHLVCRLLLEKKNKTDP